MKKVWATINKDMEEKVKPQLEARRKLRDTQEKSSEVRAIEQAQRIVNDKLVDKNNTMDTEPTTITQYECDFSSSNKPETQMLEMAERLRTLEDCDGVQKDTDRVFTSAALRITKDDIGDAKKHPQTSTFDETKFKLVSLFTGKYVIQQAKTVFWLPVTSSL